MTETDIQMMMAEAVEASQRGDAKEAIAQLQRVVQLSGAAGEPWLLLAAEFASSGQMAEAEAAFAEAILRSPKLSIARFQLGLLQVASGRPALGRLTWGPLLEEPYDNPLRHYVEGYIALIGDRYDAAILAFNRGLSLPQDNKALMQDIRNTLLAMSDQPTARPSDDVAAEEEAHLQQHVLLANYSSSRRHH